MLEVISFILILFGLLGAFLPAIPGPALSFCGVLILSYIPGFQAIDTDCLIYLGLVAGLITFLDYWLQIYSVQFFGGGRKSTIGVIIGIILGFILFPPFGIIIGPFFGAYIGALYESDFNQFRALKIASGALVGFLCGTILKLSYSIYSLFLLVSYFLW